MKPWFPLTLLILTALLLSGCSAPSAGPKEGASINGPIIKDAAGENLIFTIPVAQPRALIGLDFRASLQNGDLTAVLLDAQGTIIWQATAQAGQTFNINTVVRPETAGEYRLGLRWSGPVKGTYSLQWQPGEVPIAEVRPIALASGLGMILVAVGFLVYALMHEAQGRYLAWGALAWVGSVALKFAWAIPFNGPIYRALTQALPHIGEALFYLYVGALTGIFEVALVWAVLQLTRLAKTTWQNALGFGIAFGAIEAIILGLNSFSNVLLALLSPAVFPPGQLEQLALLNHPLYSLAPIWERFFTIFIHLGANVALFYALIRQQQRWFWAAFALKTLVDTLAAFGQFWGVDTLGKIWALEAGVAFFGLWGWWLTRAIAARFPATPFNGAVMDAAPPSVETHAGSL